MGLKPRPKRPEIVLWACVDRSVNGNKAGSIELSTGDQPPSLTTHPGVDDNPHAIFWDSKNMVYDPCCADFEHVMGITIFPEVPVKLRITVLSGAKSDD